jgi:ectoine hydroxylase-related dioxygenase (phytanoyl-CoA dioxygenase family)
MHRIVTCRQIESFEQDGAVVIPGLFADWVSVIQAGIERNLHERGPYASESVTAGGPESFFDDYCNWQRIPELRHVVEHSPAAEAAAQLMRSETAQFFHDHVLVKEPGTQKPTPWHQDSPYYFVDGQQTVSFWIPIDPVKEATLRLIAGSHRWPKPVLPVRWLNEARFYDAKLDYVPVPEPDSDPNLRVLEWQLEPGDAVARAAIRPRTAVGSCRYAGWAMMRATWTALGEPRPPSPVTPCDPGNSFVRTGSPSFGPRARLDGR